MCEVTSKEQEFRCHYELDQRPRNDLVRLNQTAYRLIQTALGDTYNVRLGDDELPDPVEVYLLYISALIHGAADAVLTLILHNLGREARIIERQIFEYSARADYYAKRPEEAKRYLISSPFREKQILDELGYDKDTDRYREVELTCNEFSTRWPGAASYREPTLRNILGPKDDQRITALYAFYYRVHSQMAHATIAGLGGVFREEGIDFDGRQENPNISLEAVTRFVLTFLSLLNEHLRIDITRQLDVLKNGLHVIQANPSVIPQAPQSE